MSSNAVPLLESPRAQGWIRQFRPADQERAATLLSGFRLVSRDEFHDGLTELIRERAQQAGGPVGLYAEREVPKRFGVPHRLFREPRLKIRRAIGTGPKPVEARMAYDKAVGSEGIVAQLITQLCRSMPNLFLNHPGPDEIRKRKARAFFVITDLVASGGHARSYLESAWRVRSVRSWWSGHFLRFEVICYASTAIGRKAVERHKCKPIVSSVIPCPDIHTAFDRPQSLVRLCMEYDPLRHRDDRSLGVGQLGVLLAFAHGAPNNTPNIIRCAGKNWTPLFPARVTSGVGAKHFGRDMSPRAIERRLVALNERVLAQSPAPRHSDERTKMIFLLLAALNKPARFDEVIAERTGLTVPEIRHLSDEFQRWGWIDRRRYLTDDGRRQLRHARKGPRQRGGRGAKTIATVEEKLYYPSSLRPPS